MPDAPHNHDQLKTALKLRVMDALDGVAEGTFSAQQRKALSDRLHRALKSLPEEFRGLKLSPDDEARIVEDILGEIVGLGPLDSLLHDEEVTEIMINGPNEIFVERAGKLHRLDVTFQSHEHLTAVIERMLGSVNLTVNELNPICDASLSNGARINVIIPPLVLNGAIVTIRRKLKDWTPEEYLKSGAITAEALQFLEACVKARVNLIISGGTSTGKTTLVSVLSAYIPPEERIITIENVAELELPNRQHWIRVVGRAANLEGRGEIPLRALVKNALRMRPDRIILGESRGGEALDMVQAMHSGHDGFMTVLHANSPGAALDRLETLMLMSGLDLPPQACRVQIAGAVDLVVHLGRFVDGSRRVAAITQVLGATPQGFTIEELFALDTKGYSADGQLQGSLRYTGVTPKVLAKFKLANVTLPPTMRG